MARPERLIAGNCYFIVNFHDRDLLFPSVTTFTFSGQDVHEGQPVWLFQEPVDLGAPAGGPPRKVDSQTYMFTASQLYKILEYPELMTALQEVALDHPLRKPTVPAAPPQMCREFGELRGQVKRFLESPDQLSVTMVIRFTDDGLSLHRRHESGALGLAFYEHPRREPQKEGRLRALFGSLQIHPDTDYLADGGRTRILGYAMPGDSDAIVSICERVLTDVYAMRSGDVLDYTLLDRSSLK